MHRRGEGRRSRTGSRSRGGSRRRPAGGRRRSRRRRRGSRRARRHGVVGLGDERGVGVGVDVHGDGARCPSRARCGRRAGRSRPGWRPGPSDVGRDRRGATGGSGSQPEHPVAVGALDGAVGGTTDRHMAEHRPGVAGVDDAVVADRARWRRSASEPFSWIVLDHRDDLGVLLLVELARPCARPGPGAPCDITPAICLGPITAILAVGHRNVNRLPNARPDMP